MKRLTIAFLLLFVALSASARGKLDGFVEQGGQNAISNLTGTIIKVQKSYPSATVTVYNAGTLTLAAIYSDSIGTAKANPFTAGTNGYWFFWAEDGDYDVAFSGSVSYTRSSLRVSGSSSRLYANVLDYGAACNVVGNADGNITVGTTTFTSALASFTSADIGKTIVVYGAGASSTLELVTTISAVGGANSVTLNAAAGTTANNVNYFYGTDDSAKFASAYASLTTGGVMAIPASGCLTSGSLTIKSGTTIQGFGNGGATAGIAGTSTGGTAIYYTGTGSWLDFTAAAGLNGFAVRDLLLQVSSTSAAGIRIGRTSDNYSDSNFRSAMRFSNLTIIGPGEAVTGKVGISLCQPAASVFDNISVYNFETGWVNSSSTVNKFIRDRVSAFRYGMIWQQLAAHPAGGELNDSATLDILGPSIDVGGSHDGYALKIDAQGVHIDDSFVEILTPGVTAKALAWFTANGRGFSSKGTHWTVSSGTVTNLFVFDNGSVRNTFTADNLNGVSGPMSIGTATGPAGANQHKFFACNDALLAAIPTPTSYAVAIGSGPGANDGLTIYSADPGTVPHLSFVPSGGVVDIKATSAATFRFGNAAYNANNLTIDDGGNVSARLSMVAPYLALNGAAAGIPGYTTFGNGTSATIGAAGGAAALPATPQGYLVITVNNATFKVPYYLP